MQKHQRCDHQNIYFRATKNKNPRYTVCSATSSACFHGDKVSRSLNLDNSTYIYLLCLHIIFHFLTFTFFLSRRNTFHSPTYLHTYIHTNSLSVFLLYVSLIVPSMQKVSESAGFKLSTSLVDLKDTNTQIAHGQRVHRLTQKHSCALKRRQQ